MTGYIYALHRGDDENDIFYIGSSNNPRKRFSRHLFNTKKWDNENKKWISSDISNINYTIIDEIEYNQKDELFSLESYWIHQFKSWGFNLKNKEYYKNKKMIRPLKIVTIPNGLFRISFTNGDKFDLNSDALHEIITSNCLHNSNAICPVEVTNKIKNNISIIEYSLNINYLDKSVTKNGIQIQLSHKEFDILYLLASNKGKVLSKQEIIQKIWNVYHSYNVGNSVEVHISSLRKKIEKPFNDKIIQTRMAFGYYIL